MRLEEGSTASCLLFQYRLPTMLLASYSLVPPSLRIYNPSVLCLATRPWPTWLSHGVPLSGMLFLHAGFLLFLLQDLAPSPPLQEALYICFQNKLFCLMHSKLKHKDAEFCHKERVHSQGSQDGRPSLQSTSSQGRGLSVYGIKNKETGWPEA